MTVPSGLGVVVPFVMEQPFRSLRSLPPCMPLDCSQMRTGRTAARDPKPDGWHQRGTRWAGSQCELFTGCLDVVLHKTPRLNLGWLLLKQGPLCVGVVSTLVVTIATGTSSIVERACSTSRNPVICFGTDFSVFFFRCGRVCFKSYLPRPHCEHRRLAGSAAETLPHLLSV